MPFLVAALLVVAVHAATAIGAWRLDDGLALTSAMHCGTALVWFVLVRRLCGSNAAALAAAVVFAGWPGHSEVTHGITGWLARVMHGISARAVVQGALFMALALVVHDVALTNERTSVRRTLLVLAAIAAGIAAAGAASSTAIVVTAAALSWLRTTGERRATRALVSTVPIVVGVVVGMNCGKVPISLVEPPSWRSSHLDAAACVDWLTVLVAPVHHGYGPANMTCLLAVLTSALLVVAASAVRVPAARGVLAIAALVLVVGALRGFLLGGSDGERLDAATLQNVRNTYVPALGLCTLLGVGIAMLPLRARGAALAIVVVVHAVALDQNRQPWFRAAAVRERMFADLGDVDRLTQRPFRVLDVPHQHDGAYVFPVHYGSRHDADRLSLYTTTEWPDVLHEIATAASGGRGFADAWLVQWDDGALVPFVLDPRWPQQLDTHTIQIVYARIARVHPFAGTTLPVHVVAQIAAPLRLRVEARANETSWSGPTIDVAASEESQAIELGVLLPAAVAGEAVVIELVAEPRSGERRVYPLGTSTPVARR